MASFQSLTKVKMAFVRSVGLPCPTKTRRSGDLFINTAITLRATQENDITIEQPSFGQKVGQYYNGSQ